MSLKYTLKINFQLKKQKRLQEFSSGEYGEWYTCTILCFPENFR